MFAQGERLFARGWRLFARVSVRFVCAFVCALFAPRIPLVIANLSLRDLTSTAAMGYFLCAFVCAFVCVFVCPLFAHLCGPTQGVTPPRSANNSVRVCGPLIL